MRISSYVSILLVVAMACSSGPASKPALGTWGVELSAMDTTVHPGNDFFEYTNGTWLNNFEIPGDRSSYGAFTVLRDSSEARVKRIIDELTTGNHPEGTIEQKVADYFASYMDTESVNDRGIAPLQPLLDEINQISSRQELIKMFGRAGKDDLDSPISGSIGIDRIDPDRYMVNVGQSGLTLPDRDYYLKDNPRFNEIRTKYEAHIGRMLGFAGMKSPKKQAKAIMALETEMARHHWPRTELRNRDKTYNVYSFDKLQNEFGDFDWTTFFDAYGIDKLDELNVTTPTALPPLIKLIDRTSLETWKSYLSFKAVIGHANLLAEEIDQANFEFFGQVLSGQPEQRPRWKRGVSLVGARNGLGEALGQIYVERYFPESSKKQMVALVENLREAYRRRIEKLDWMGEETKQEALAKLAAFNPKIGYPDEWQDFSDITIMPGQLFKNAKAVSDFFYEDQLSRLHKKTDKDRWFMTPQTVNAYYNPSWNEIVFPAAILQAPFFDPHADMAVNYGGIGGVIGHEMGHGFDDQGSKVDANGVQRNWWTDEDRANFEKRTRALGAQYDQFEPIPGEFVNGSLTMGENIGDLGGLSVAYEAYKIATEGKQVPLKNGYTGEQRFFLGWAQVWRAKSRAEAMLRRIKSDPHSPPRYRVNGVVRNMDAWYKAFDITREHALYLPPEERVSIW